MSEINVFVPQDVLEEEGPSNEEDTQTNREKVYLGEEDRLLLLTEIMEKYGVSKATASRARKSGWFFRGYLEKVSEPDQRWNEQNAERIRKIAIRALLDLKIRFATSFDFVIKNNDDEEDLIQDGILYILQRSGSSSFIKNGNGEISSRDVDNFIKKAIYNYITDVFIKRAKEVKNEAFSINDPGAEPDGDSGERRASNSRKYNDEYSAE